MHFDSDNGLIDDRLIKVAKDQVCCDLDGEAVILSVKTGKYYGLDEVGARIWDLIHKPMTTKELLSIILAEFEVEPVRCEQDIRHLLQNLSEAGLVEIGA